MHCCLGHSEVKGRVSSYETTNVEPFRSEGGEVEGQLGRDPYAHLSYHKLQQGSGVFLVQATYDLISGTAWTSTLPLVGRDDASRSAILVLSRFVLFLWRDERVQNIRLMQQSLIRAGQEDRYSS